MSYKKLKIYIIIITTIVVLSAAGNMVYASYQEIPKPLFTTINMETVYKETFDETLTIFYITNNRDKRRLESVSFEGLESIQRVSQTGFFSSFTFTRDVNDNPYNDNIGRYYTLKRGYIDLHLTEEDINRLEEKGSLTLGSGTANLDDGTTMPVSLGRITIHSKENWEKYRLREGGSGSDGHFKVDFKTETPIQITSIDLSSFEPHQEAVDMELIVDHDKVYTYADLTTETRPISVDRSFQFAFTAYNHDVSSQWRFNMISMDMSYIKESQTYDTCIFYPFYGSGMDEASVEAYVAFWRTENEL